MTLLKIPGDPGEPADSGHWAFHELNLHEMDLLAGIASAATPGDSKEARDRLYPSPLGSSQLMNREGLKGASAEEQREAFLADWSSFVVPELAERFEGHLAAVTRDLGRAEIVDIEPGDESLVVHEKTPADALDLDEEPIEMEGPRYRIVLPDEAAEYWFSALNQARIVLSEKYRLHDGEEEDEFLAFLIEEAKRHEGSESTEGELEPQTPERTPEEVEERWEAVVQCQFYGMIQDWLLTQVMT